MSKCPKCEGIVRRAIVNAIGLDVPGGSKWNGLAYACPYCSTILGVQIDPVALKTDTVNEIATLLGKR